MQEMYRRFRLQRWARVAVLAVAIIALSGCATVVKRSAVQTPVDSEQRVGIVLQSDQEGAFASTLRAAFVERGYQTVFLADESAIPEAARNGRRFSALDEIVGSIGESGEVQMPNGDFQSFLDQTSIDASLAYLRSYASFLQYVSEERDIDVLLVLNNEGALRVWAYAYELETDGVLFSYYLAANAAGFATGVPRVSAEDAAGWTVAIPFNPTSNADIRAIDVAEDLVGQLTDQ